MSNNNETTTKFKVDISELKQAMQEAKRSIAVANSEFKAVSSSMDDWSKSSDGISAKLKQLETTMSAQKTVLNSLEAQYEAVKEEQGENSKAADDLLIKINNQKAAINKTEKEISNYQTTLGEVSEAEKKAAKSGKDVSDVLDEMKNEAEDAGDGFTVLKGAMAEFAGNVVTGLANTLKDAAMSMLNLAGETREYRAELGKLETAFTTAGHSSETATKTYKDLYAVLGDEGQATEAANHLAKLAKNEQDLAKWTNIATGVYGTFGDSLPIEGLTEAANETAKTGALTGGLADALNWAGVNEDKFQAQLDKCSNEQERQALIMDTLNGLYDDAATKYKEVNKDLMDAQRAESELADATAQLGAVAEPVTTSFKLMGAEFLNSLLPSVKELGSGFTDLINGTKGAEEGIATALSNIVTSVLTKLTQIMPQVASIAVSLITNLTQSILSMLPQVLDLGLQIITQLIQGITGAAPDLITSIVSCISGLIDAILDNLPLILEAGIELLVALGEGLLDALPDLLKKVPEIIDALCSTIVKLVPEIIEAGVTLLTALTEDLPYIIECICDAIPIIINAIVSNIEVLVPALVNAGVMLLTALVKNLPLILATILLAVSQILSSIVASIIDAVPRLAQTGLTLLKGIVGKIGEAAKWIGSKMVTIVTAMKTAITNKINEFKTIGKNIVEGVWNGIKGMKDTITKNVKKFFTGIVDGAKDALGIHSPSRVFRDQVGAQIAEGVIVGIKNKYKKVKKTAAELATLTYEAAKERLDTQKKYSSISLVNELSYWKKIVNSTKKGTQGYKDALLEYKTVRDSLNEQIKKAEDDYATKVSEVKTKLISDIQAVTDKYDDAVKSRANSIVSSMKLFDEFSSTTEKSAEDLLNNLESQVNGIYEWDEALRALSSRGVSDGLVTQLQEMGVSALADIKTLVAMTDEELTKYVALWDIKNQLATDRAVEEYKGLREESQAEIQKLIQTANKDLNELEKDYKNTLLELGVAVSDTSVDIGKGIVQSLKKGIESQREELMSYLKSLFSSIVSTAKSSLNLTGAISGSDLGSTLNSVNTSGVSSTLSGLSSAASSSTGGTGATTVINNYEQTINSPQALTRLEIYRQSKNLLAFNGGA